MGTAWVGWRACRTGRREMNTLAPFPYSLSVFFFHLAFDTILIHVSQGIRERYKEAKFLCFPSRALDIFLVLMQYSI